jgi:beta-lactamase regulating signal transducer with metallopeptidase domain
MIGEILSGLPLWATLLAQGTTCAALALAASYLLSRHPARAHQVLLAGVLTAVLTPALYLLVHHFGLGVLVAEVEPAPPNVFETVTLGVSDTLEPSVVEGPSVPPVVELAEPPMTVTPLPWRAIFLGTWAVTSLLLLGRLALRLGLGLHLLRVSEPLKCNKLHEALAAAKAQVGVNASVRLRRSERVHSPVIWCWSRRPVLLVQAEAEKADANTDWVSVFSHELAHWRRRDQCVGLAAELLTVAVPWHPLTWWIERRLLRLSEEVCDDWAVAGAPTGVDYAESLLNLSPEKQWTFLPTVVGKEKAMKERIRRIVRDGCSNPRIGARWTAAVCILAVLATVSVAFAQRRPVEPERREAEEREEMRLDAEHRELAIAGRRNVLRRLLEELVAQTQDIEASLREGGDEVGEEGQILRAELQALREHIEIVERQLQAVNRGRERPDAPPESERHAEELRRHQQELMTKTEHLELELRELGENHPERRGRVEAELQAIRKHRRDLDREMANVERRRAEIEHVRATEARARARDSAQRAAHVTQLTERLRRLEISAVENNWALRKLDDKDSNEAQKLRQTRSRHRDC